jgi:hypothetical protein
MIWEHVPTPKNRFQCFFRKTIHGLTFCISGVILFVDSTLGVAPCPGWKDTIAIRISSLSCERLRSIWTCIGEPNSKPSRKSQLLRVLGLPSPNGSFTVVGCVFSQNYELLCSSSRILPISLLNKPTLGVMFQQYSSLSSTTRIYLVGPHYRNIKPNMILVGGSEHFFHIFGNNSNWLSYCSEGLKPPTRIGTRSCLRSVVSQVTYLVPGDRNYFLPLEAWTPGMKEAQPWKLS